MDTFELKVGDKIGVYFYDDWRGSKAIIDEVEDISANGTVTLTSGIRYNKLGREVGALGEGTSLCTVEKAQKTIDKSCLEKGNKRNKENNSIVDTLKTRQDKASRVASQSAIRILNQYGYFNSANDDIDALETEIEELIISYLEKQTKID